MTGNLYQEDELSESGKPLSTHILYIGSFMQAICRQSRDLTQAMGEY